MFLCPTQHVLTAALARWQATSGVLNATVVHKTHPLQGVQIASGCWSWDLPEWKLVVSDFLQFRWISDQQPPNGEISAIFGFMCLGWAISIYNPWKCVAKHWQNHGTHHSSKVFLCPTQHALTAALARWQATSGVLNATVVRNTHPLQGVQIASGCWSWDLPEWKLVVSDFLQFHWISDQQPPNGEISAIFGFMCMGWAISACNPVFDTVFFPTAICQTDHYVEPENRRSGSTTAHGLNCPSQWKDSCALKFKPSKEISLEVLVSSSAIICDGLKKVTSKAFSLDSSANLGAFPASLTKRRNSTWKLG